ncbi:hypothetical protein F2P81_010435 [Scophthalmus maximus]|uniref:Uncharacterized protein n=1 Tax=Scophthalmus maximus TaxID=52904 RepID=A0A6A4T2W0_SCOMX|nr:hypothetical protein F2P81_010435 [Scophthalmus maximus]
MPGGETAGNQSRFEDEDRVIVTASTTDLELTLSELVNAVSKNLSGDDAAHVVYRGPDPARSGQVSGRAETEPHSSTPLERVELVAHPNQHITKTNGLLFLKPRGAALLKGSSQSDQAFCFSEGECDTSSQKCQHQPTRLDAIFADHSADSEQRAVVFSHFVNTRTP